MKIVFFGLGSIARKHIDILLKNYQYETYAFRSGVNPQGSGLNIRELYSWNEVRDLKPEVAFITNPTALHIETAIECAKMNCKLFIEKPLDKNINKLDDLIEIIKAKSLVTYLAYNLRFHPVIEQLKKYISLHNFLHMSVLTTSYYPNWRSNTDYKKRYSANADLGGGVILDLSHEIDYTEHLLGKVQDLLGQFSKRSDLTNNTEDYADLLLQTTQGPSNVHINFFSQKKQRIIQIDFKELTVVGDLINSTIEKYKNEKIISKDQLDNNPNSSYEKQLKYFFDNIENTKMMNNIIDASNLFRKIIEFKNKNE